MLRSMTAFARTEQNYAFGSLTWELRSVNHRYLDISFRLPEDMRGLEQTVREKINIAQGITLAHPVGDRAP